MNEDNKKRVTVGAKKLALAVYAILTIATCAGVWNFCPEKAVKFGDLLLFACNAVSIVSLWKKSDD
jgi:hypothetical protein